MKRLNILCTTLILVFAVNVSWAQTADSTKSITQFSGGIGITNNGFSIIPTFSLNSPAAIINLAWMKKRFSFEPDIRLVPDASKGGMLWWLRYQLVNKEKFRFRVGMHPAFTLVRETVTVNGESNEITQMLRFVAFEAVPSYSFNKKISMNAMYLQGNALQSTGPQLTQVLFINTNFENLGLVKGLRLSLYPSVFFLKTDGYRGDYFSLRTVLAHEKSPFSLQSIINQTLKSNLPGNQNFQWNIALVYGFSKRYTRC